jgi:Domain of unknown function (DUF4158)
MNKIHFTQEQLTKVAWLSDEDIQRINQCRGARSKLGFAYQLCYVKLFNRLPAQSPFIAIDELATFVAVQLDVPVEQLSAYSAQQVTFSLHQQIIREYLQVEKFGQQSEQLLRGYLLQQAQQIQATESLFVRATEFLREQKVLSPSDDTIERFIQTQREKARTTVFENIVRVINSELKQVLDDLLVVNAQYSKLYQIKEAPRTPSAASMKLLANKLTLIERTGALRIDLSWLNNNYKRYLSSYANRCDANKLKELTASHRYAVLVCFLQEAYQNTTDYIFDMYQKALNSIYTKADNAIADYNRSKHSVTRSCLSNHKKLCKELLALADGKTELEVLLQKYPSATLQARIVELDTLLTGRYSHNLNIVADKFSHDAEVSETIARTSIPRTRADWQHSTGNGAANRAGNSPRYQAHCSS